MLASRMSHAIVRRAFANASLAVRKASTQAGQEQIAARLNTKRPDLLLKFKKMSDTREAHHLTSYLLAAGIPLSLLVGPIPAFDTVVGLAIPLHFHIGMRSVIIDYVWDIPTQRIAITALGIFTALTAVGLTKFNLTDVGLTKAIKQLWIKVPAEAIEDKKKN